MKVGPAQVQQVLRSSAHVSPTCRFLGSSAGKSFIRLSFMSDMAALTAWPAAQLLDTMTAAVLMSTLLHCDHCCTANAVQCCTVYSTATCYTTSRMKNPCACTCAPNSTAPLRSAHFCMHSPHWAVLACPSPEELFLQQVSTGGSLSWVVSHHAAL